MPKYKVSLKQGSKTWVEYIETDNLQSLLDFYSQITTAKIKKVEEIVYEDPSNSFIIDDGNYWDYVKVFVRNKSTSKMKQYIFKHIKRNKNEKELASLFKQYLKIDGGKVDAVVSLIIKG